MLTQLLRLPEVIKLSGRARSTLYLHVQKGTFPPGIKLGGDKAAGWPLYEVELLNTAIIAGKSDEDLVRLVEKLTSKRKEVFGKRDEEVRNLVDQLVRDMEGGNE